MTGSQMPRIRIEPPRVATDGTGAAMLSKEYGLTLDPWQEMVLDCWLGTDAGGKYTVTTGGLSTPRQNGKNCVCESRVLFGLLVNGEKILWTAHQVRTYKRAFLRLAAIFNDRRHPEIVATVKQTKYGIGEEAIYLHNGGSVEFVARTRQAARGFDGISLVIYDEAQELLEAHVEALTATLSASATGSRQILYLGTPPYPGCTGDVFRRFRAACIDGAGTGNIRSSSWHEWSVPGDSISEIDVSDKRIWYETNPALGTRLSEEFTGEELRLLSNDGFARERLGWWAPVVDHAAAVYMIDARLWDSCGSDEPKPEGKTAYGIKFTPDGSEVVLAGACIPREGPARINLIDIVPTGRGLSWLASWLNERYHTASCVVIDGRNGADVLVDKIQSTWRLKDSIRRPRGTEVAAAAALLINDLAEHAVTWYAPQDILRESAINAVKRPISGGWGFGGQGSAPIEACSLALWGCKTSKRDPTRKMKIG